MAEREPTTQTIDVTEARQKWSQLINKVFRREARVIVEKSGIPVAAIISAQDLERFNRWEAKRARDLAVLEAMSEPFKDAPPEEIEREAAKALAEVRQEMREERRQQASQRP
jgi:prevent-host-death family protein